MEPDRWVGTALVVWVVILTGLFLYDEVRDDIAALRGDIDALRVEIECRDQPDDCDVARLLSELQRGR